VITLYLIRHGETEFNREGRIQGHADSPLTSLGRRQAQAIAERLSTESFNAIYSSDLGRAYHTAEAIAAPHNLPINSTPLLRENAFGIIQGLTQAEIDERYPADQHEWRRNPLTMRPPGAETREEVLNRCAEFLTEIPNCHTDGDKVLIVSHGGSLRGLIITACSLPIEFYRAIHLSNASLSMLTLGNHPAIWLLNDTCHLQNIVTYEEEADRLG